MLKCILFNVASGTNFAGNGRSVGVYRISHHLREEGWDVEVIDFANEWSLEDLKLLAKSRMHGGLKFFGFSHMYSIWTETLEKFCQWIKKEYSDIVLISGSSVSPQFTSIHLDFYIQGFGENAITALLSWLFGNGPKPIFSIFKANGKPLIAANDNYPSYPRRNLNVIYEDRDFIESEEWLGIEFSRGCKFSCDFCNFPVLGVKGDYTRDAENFEIQIKDAYDRFGVTNYLVSDETFNDRTEKITKFADIIDKLDFKPWFSGFIRPDLLINRPQDREELLRMNFLGHHYGIESFNYKAVKSIGKGMNPEKVKQGLIDVRKYFENNGIKKYRALLTFIIGLPHETKDDIERTTRWLIENWQGQSWTPFVLEIPVGELNRKSKMSMNYEKYGYRIFQGEHKHLEYKQARVSKDLLIWEHDHMNYFDAYDLFYKMIESRNDLNNNFTLAPWDLAMIGLPGNVYDRLMLHNSCLQDKIIEENRIKFIQRYIRKKLEC